MLAGMILGQIRTLQKSGPIASCSVFLNLLITFFTYVLLVTCFSLAKSCTDGKSSMGVAAHSAPNYDVVFKSYGIPQGPIIKSSGTPAGSTFVNALNGLNQAVYSYAGAQLYLEFMAEMRHPWDFWKSLICAQSFIYTVYVFFGVFIYSYQGQFSYIVVFQGLSPYAWQTVCNVLSLISGLIAAVLYGNIGIKVLYINVFEDVFGCPPLTKKSGKLIWVALVPVYWVVAFVLAAAVPQLTSISNLISALFLLQFTYTFPPILYLGMFIKRDAILQEERFDHATCRFHRHDNGWRRWARGFAKQWPLNTWNTFFALGAVTTAVWALIRRLLS